MKNADQFLDAFPQWLRGLAQDGLAIGCLLEQGPPPQVRRLACMGVNYLIGDDTDLVPPGLKDIDLLDDAMVLRVIAKEVLPELTTEGSAQQTLTRTLIERLADEESLVRDFLEDRSASFHRFVMESSTAEVGTEETKTLVGRLVAWATSYHAPTFARDPRNLLVLRTILDAHLRKHES